MNYLEIASRELWLLMLLLQFALLWWLFFVEWDWGTALGNWGIGDRRDSLSD